MTSESAWATDLVPPSIRVISDNDYCGDPDGLVQLAHHLLSPSVDVVGIIGANLRVVEPWGPISDDIPAASVAAAARISQLCGRDGDHIVPGSGTPLSRSLGTLPSAGAELIIEEALREDDRPLFVCCGAGLGEVARAWLLEPRIADRLTVVWIGGSPYASGLEPHEMEYNCSIDPIATQVVFNDSDLPLWQFPRDVYRQTLVSRAELMHRMEPNGALGAHLMTALASAPKKAQSFGSAMGETYILGDSPLVLATALGAAFDHELASSEWVDLPRHRIEADGSYGMPRDDASVRVFTRIDNRLWMEDLWAKLALRAKVGS